MGKLRLWIDTDVGTNPDDAVALLVAGAHPAVELVGVSVTGDERPRRAGEAERLLPGVPVVGAGGAGEVTVAVGAARPEAVLAIGPLTNVAAMPAGPALTVMGGALAAVWHRGAWREVESNFGADPAAAAVALRRFPLATVVPLDATVATGLDDAPVARLLEVAPALTAHVKRWQPNQVHLHDAAALLVAVGEIGADGRGVVTVDEVGRVAVDRSAQNGHNLVTSLDGRAVLERALDILTAAT